MVNEKRVVPIQKIDFLSLIGTALNLIGTSFSVLAAADVEGAFTVTGSGSVGNVLANQPAKTIDFAEGVTAATVYFVAAYDFAGVKIAGAAVTPTGSVKADGITLYKAVLATGAVTITAVTPSLS